MLAAGPALAQFDWGDAPDSYQTEAATNGPSHAVSPFLRLREIVDSEADGQPTGFARGDDLNGMDDEDGVQVYESAADRVVGAQIGAWSQVQVMVHRAAGIQVAWLNGWCDLNRNGDFTDAGERIATNQPAVNGLNTMAFFTPRSTMPGASLIRVRLSSVPLAPAPSGYFGRGGLGEVEDLLIDLTDPSPATNVQAYARHGQVWITWQFTPSAAAQVYDVYTSNVPMVNVAQGTLVARLLPDDYCGRRLVGELAGVFGAGGISNFTIPDAAGGAQPRWQSIRVCVWKQSARRSWRVIMRWCRAVSRSFQGRVYRRWCRSPHSRSCLRIPRPATCSRRGCWPAGD